VSLLTELDAFFTDHHHYDLYAASTGRSSGSRATAGPAWPVGRTRTTSGRVLDCRNP
jgi:hypothetical protein